jgi:hypothetical protein
MPEEEHHEGGKKPKVSRNTWLALGVVAGVVVYVWYKRRQAAAAAAGVATLPAGMPSGAQSGVSTSPAGGPGTTFLSLQDWMSAVQRWATTLGFDAANTQNALQAYAGGHCLSSTQYAILNQALTVFGAPPNAPYQGLVQCTNQPPPPPPPPPKDLVKVGSGYGTKSFGTPVKVGGSTYMQLPGGSLDAFYAGGGTAYYMPTPGQIVAVPKGTIPWLTGLRNLWGLLTGTPLFQKVG